MRSPTLTLPLLLLAASCGGDDSTTGGAGGTSAAAGTMSQGASGSGGTSIGADAGGAGTAGSMMSAGAGGSSAGAGGATTGASDGGPKKCSVLNPNACDACVFIKCCDAYDACENNDDCNTAIGHLSECVAADSTMAAPCYDDFAATNDKSSALRTCIKTSCDAACMTLTP